MFTVEKLTGARLTDGTTEGSGWIVSRHRTLVGAEKSAARCRENYILVRINAPIKAAKS